MEAMSITSLALMYRMADKAKVHEFDHRVSQVIDEVRKVFLEVKHSMFG